MERKDQVFVMAFQYGLDFGKVKPLRRKVPLYRNILAT